MELQEPEAHLRDDIRQALIVMVYARDGDPAPFVSATYKMFSTHPDRVWAKITAMQKAMLGAAYGQIYDESGNQRPQHLEIPDYDPACGQAPQLSGTPEPQPDTRIKFPKAPLRRVVRVNEVCDGGRVMYHLEELECGHSHTEFLGAGPYKARRRCHECSMGVPRKLPVPWEESSANVVEASPIRRQEPQRGKLLQMPSPPRSAQQKPLRILPA